jgi:hypothetical protein
MSSYFPQMCLALAAFVCFGCGSGPKLVSVTGRVLVEGKPATGAYVQFHPEGKNTPPWPSARVKEDGSFQVTTLLPGEKTARRGAPPGRYAVTVMLRTTSQRGDSDEQDLLPTRYQDPTTSQLTAVVLDEATELPPFELTAK